MIQMVPKPAKNPARTGTLGLGLSRNTWAASSRGPRQMMNRIMPRTLPRATSYRQHSSEEP